MKLEQVRFERECNILDIFCEMGNADPNGDDDLGSRNDNDSMDESKGDCDENKESQRVTGFGAKMIVTGEWASEIGPFDPETTQGLLAIRNWHHIGNSGSGKLTCSLDESRSGQ